ncbi:MAG: conjugal transfer protein TraL [Alphaproteobacteria bacterium]|nr:conjugal transfer protein TraL [Rhodospirillales bacterium]MCW9045320.1 conjugal transfer protein TraL [Alphaproteobacteria bacterium]
MALINLLLQGKGGVGKSYIASLLAQHYTDRDLPLMCYDTDPVNRTFAGYKSFGAEIVKLGERPDEVNPQYFDTLLGKIMEVPEGGVVVIDNGASTFLPLLGYMVEADALSLLREAGHTVRLHTVLTGGQALNDTMQGLAQVLGHIPDVPVVVWLNEYFGPIERVNNEGQREGFEHSGLYQKNQDRIHALIRLPEVRKETFGHDIGKMMRARLSFDQAIQHPEFHVMTRQRLKIIWQGLQSAMDRAVL